jgi:cysteine desulfurase
MEKRENMIYLDNAATTKTAPEVVEAMLPYFSEFYGNPSSIYKIAGKSKEAVAKGREQIANVLGTDPANIYFTAGGSESDNWALKATFELYKGKGNHIITTKIEHHAILHTCEYLEKQRGARITYLDVDENGLVDLEQLKAAITPETILISVMFANNEIGTIEPIKEIGEIAKEHNILFHTDAVQAFGQVPIKVDELGIDMLSSSGHKLNGPKGIGFLYIRKGVKIRSFMHGGQQERKRRAGTENVPGIVGYGKAAEIADRTMAERTAKEIELRDYMIKRLSSEIPQSKLNGHPTKRLPNNVNFSFEFVEGESLLIMLDMKEICATSGSACTSGSLDPSHVLMAIGLPHEIAHGSLRLTLSAENTKEEIDFAVDAVKEIVAKLRSMSPLYEDFLAGKKASVIDTKYKAK